MKDRIKELRTYFHLTQEEFGNRLRIKRGAVSNYEIGRNIPTDSVLELMVREFGVSAKWLRTGEGPMFDSRNQELQDFFSRVLGDDDESFVRQLVSVLATLEPSEWRLLEKMARMLKFENAPAVEPEDMSLAEQHAELDRQWGLEKDTGSESEASGSGG